MAWRLHDHVLRGELDNRMRGRVTGRIWLAGIEKPLVLDLLGDCEPDLAGCLLRFENPRPVALTTRPPAPRQRGKPGEITAARKVRVFDIPFEEAYAMLKAGGTPPEHMANSLYLEWYSPLSGRFSEPGYHRLAQARPRDPSSSGSPPPDRSVPTHLSRYLASRIFVTNSSPFVKRLSR
jgi:hypothetical protein